MSKSSKTETTQNVASHMTQAPTNPDWVSNGLQGLGGTLTGLGQADPSSFVAGPDPLQLQAGQAASGLSVSPDFGKAAAGFGGIGDHSVAGASLLDGLAGYMSPYTDQVVNTSLADYDHNAGYTRAQDTLARAGDETFGGSGGAIQTAMSNDNIDRGRATLDAQLRDQDFQVGAGLSGQDAQRRQEAQAASAANAIAAAQGLSVNATAQNNAANTNINTQSTIGQILQLLAQQRAAAPLATAGALDSMWSALPLGLLHGQTSDGTQNSTGTSNTTTSDPMGSLASLVSAGGSLATGLGSMGIKLSDARLKRDVVRIGELASGLGLYAYRYLHSAARHVGVMAQEVLRLKPEAVVTLPNGFLAVNYGAL